MAAKVLFIDIETAPILTYVWGLFNQNIGLEQIKEDWHLLSWAAKWGDSKEVLYMDQRSAKNIEDDKKIAAGAWKLLDEADVVVTQNGKAFDIKKLNARFIVNGMKPPSSFRSYDTLEVAKKKFGFTSNKLAYMTEKLNSKYKKLEHEQFPGFKLWRECLAGNKKAWNEMEKYNKHDVLALEELYYKLAPWDPSINMAAFSPDPMLCSCGSKEFIKNGFRYSNQGKYQKMMCVKCGSEHRQKVNLLDKAKRKSLLAT